MKFKAVLFDLDGTLLDTLEDIAGSANRVLSRLGFPQHRLEAYKYFVGDGMENLAARTLPKKQRDPATLSELVTAIGARYGIWNRLLCA